MPTTSISEVGSMHDAPCMLMSSFVIGGSTFYNPTEATDWDGLIVVQSFSDVLYLLHHPPVIATLLDIPEVDENYFILLSQIRATAFQNFDGFRFSGQSSHGIKKSVKVVSMEALERLATSPAPSTLRIVSTKDKRLQITVAQDKVVCMVSHGSHPAEFSPSSDLPILPQPMCTILYDPDVAILHDPKTKLTRTRPGLILDILLSSEWRLTSFTATDTETAFRPNSGGGSRHEELRRIVVLLVQKLVHFHTDNLPFDLSTLLCRHHRFKTSLQQTISDGLKFMLGQETMILRSNCDLYPHIATTSLAITQSHSLPCKSKSNSLLPDFSQAQQFAFQSISFPFSSGNLAGKVHTTMQDGNTETYFWKVVENGKEEQFQARLLRSSPLGVRTLLPTGLTEYQGKQVICYPWIKGVTLASIRLHLLLQQSSMFQGLKMPFWPATSHLLNVAAQRADDMVTTYSLGRLENLTQGPSRIHDAFSRRLQQNSRLNHFYGTCGIPLGDGLMPWTVDQFLSANITVNGNSQPSFATLFSEAASDLCPSYLSAQLQSIGHGDLHLGNIIVCDDLPNGTYQPMYVDYGFGGVHSPWLDIAKVIYNDSFHPYFYADHLGRNLFQEKVISLQVTEKAVSLSFSAMCFQSPSDRDGSEVGDVVGKALLELARHKLIEPVVRLEMETGSGPRIGKGVVNDLCGPKILSSALLCCALLTRDWNKRPDIFWSNVAIALQLRHALLEFNGRDARERAASWEKHTNILFKGSDPMLIL